MQRIKKTQDFIGVIDGQTDGYSVAVIARAANNTSLTFIILIDSITARVTSLSNKQNHPRTYDEQVYLKQVRHKPLPVADTWEMQMHRFDRGNFKGEVIRYMVFILIYEEVELNKVQPSDQPEFRGKQLTLVTLFALLFPLETIFIFFPACRL